MRRKITPPANLEGPWLNLKIRWEGYLYKGKTESKPSIKLQNNSLSFFLLTIKT